MICVAVDVDDTLINTERRIQSIWSQILGRDVPMQAVETLDSAQIFEKFASQDQKAHANEFQRRFWDLVLCSEETEINTLKLDEPVPFAADALQKWSKRCKLVYLTGRIEATRDLTSTELEKFGFPMDNGQLVMFNIEDYSRVRGENPSGPTLVEARSKRVSSLTKECRVVRVVDDYPGYFPVYKQFEIPDRIGLLRSRRYSPQRYVDRGATRVVGSWKQIQDDLPTPT